MVRKVRKTDEEWRSRLTPEQYTVCRQQGTEKPFSGKYWDCKQDGVYHCACCGAPLFDSEKKFDSGTGWPSFSELKAAENVELLEDASHGMRRIEVRCKACEAHLGHVFDDGPGPSGQRFCINSVALDLKADE